MNYARWRTFSKDLLGTEAGGRLRRLDCMNPVKALAPLTPELGDRLPPRTVDAVIRSWAELFEGAVSSDHVAWLDRGVRALLERLFSALPKETRLWAPVDVYPVYLELAIAAGLKVATYETCPALRLPTEAPSDPPEALLIANPLVPAGRALSKWEAEQLEEWLDADARRRLFIDAVYTFGPPPTSTRNLMRHPRAVLLHSMAKSFLSPDLAGIAFLSGAPAVNGLPDEVLRHAAHLLEAHRELPNTLQRAFDERWARVSDLSRPLEFNIPKRGYFSISRLSSEAARAKGALTVPSTVFGATREDWSIVTCLLG